MTTARPVRPTDLVALVSFDGKVYPNEAHTWDRLGRNADGPRLLENAFEQWLSFATGRHTWISIQGQTIRGVASARPRGSRLAWEIDCLIVAADDSEPILLALLEQLSAAAVRARVLRVFLRAEAGSDVVVAAHKAGFAPYVSEKLFRLSAGLENESIDPMLEVHDRNRAHGFALFRLYNRVTPMEVRQFEAATYAEWIACQEKRSQGRSRLDAVAEVGGEAMAWVRSVPDGGVGRIDLLLHPDAFLHAGSLLSLAVTALGDRRPVFCLVPADAEGLAGLLQERGFEPEAEYLGMVKRLAIPARQAASVRVPVQTPLATVLF